MGNFTNTLLALIDAGSSQAKGLIEDFNNVVDSFDMYEQFELFREKKNELIKKGNELFGDFNELLKQVKENISDFSVTVPFDETCGEKITYEVKDGRLVIEVSYEDETSSRSNKTSVKVPENCDLDNITLEKDALKKTATISIPKIITNKENATSDEKPKKTVTRKKTPKRDVENSEASTAQVASKLARKLKQNVAKYSQTLNRDSSGRFVRRTPNA